MEEKKIFSLTFTEYIIRYLSIYIIVFLVNIGLIFLDYFLRKTQNLDPGRLDQLLKFINSLNIVFLIVISYSIGRFIFSKYAFIKYQVFGRAFIVGIIAGILTGLAKSIAAFLKTIFTGELGNAVIDLISFLWNSWGYAAIYIVLAEVTLGIFWLSENSKKINTDEEQLSD